MHVDPALVPLLDAVAPGRARRGLDAAPPPGSVDRYWNSVLGLADWHRMTTPLGCHLREQDAPVPGWVLERLDEAYGRSVAHTLIVGHVRREVLNAFAAADIPVMVLKGSALSELVYADPATRDMEDIDVLVRPAQLGAAVEVLAQLGLRGAPGASAAPHHHEPLIGIDGLVPVEVHHLLVDPRRTPATIDVAELWARGVQSDGRPGHMLPAGEDLLMHVCLHFVSSRKLTMLGALGQLRDIAATISRLDINWELLTANARRYRVGGVLYLALSTLTHLGVSLPDAVLPSLRPGRFDDRAAEEFARLRVFETRQRIDPWRWEVSVAGARTLLGWARRYLGDFQPAAPGAFPEDPAQWLPYREATPRLLAHLLRERRSYFDDLRVTRMMTALR